MWVLMQNGLYYMGMMKTEHGSPRIIEWKPEMTEDIRRAMTFRTKADAVSYKRFLEGEWKVVKA